MMAFYFDSLFVGYKSDKYVELLKGNNKAMLGT